MKNETRKRDNSVHRAWLNHRIVGISQVVATLGNELFRKLYLALALTLATSVYSAAEPICQTPIPQTKVDKSTVYQVDKIWSGTRVTFGALMKGTRVYITYYNAQRWLSVAELDLRSDKLCRITLRSRFAGWDSHNGTAIASANDGTIHISANMHGDRMMAARSDPSGSLNSIAIERMIGLDESRVTYPTFLRSQDGQLYFYYRDGGAGDGKWFINHWRNGNWARIGELFSARSRSGTVSAYPSKFVQGSDGVWHVAIVWRRPGDVTKNFAVTYAATRDLRSFTASDGRRLTLPLSVDQSDMVENTREHAGLMNSASIILEGDQRPILLYTRYGADGRNVIVAARPGNHSWNIKEIAKADRRVAIAGAGTLSAYPRVNVNSDGSNGDFYVAFPGQPNRRLRLSLATLEPTQTVPKPSDPPMVPIPTLPLLQATKSIDLVQPQVLTAAVPDLSRKNVVRGKLEWLAQASNNDQPRPCGLDGRAGCAPPPTTLLFVMPSANAP